jgi:hypothetical protein
MARYIELSTPDSGITQGMELSFRAPCNCSEALGIKLDGQNYSLVDASGSSLQHCSGYFTSGAILTVIIDTVNFKATLLNPRVNTYTQSLGTEEDEASPDGKTVWARVKNAEDRIDEVERYAKSKPHSLVYGSLKSMFNDLVGKLCPKPAVDSGYDPSTALPIGTPIYITNRETPDFWIGSLNCTEHGAELGLWTYTNDDTILNLIKEDGNVQIGVYELHSVEPFFDEDKLSEYVKRPELQNYVTNYAFELQVQATNAELSETKAGIESCAKKNDLGAYAKTTDLQPYAKTVDFA